jgi:hypothetical protein
MGVVLLLLLALQLLPGSLLLVFEAFHLCKYVQQ